MWGSFYVLLSNRNAVLQTTPADKARKGTTKYEELPAPPPAYTIVQN